MTNRDDFAIRILCTLIPHAGTTGASALAEMSVALADKLLAVLHPAAPATDPRGESKERQALTDECALAVLTLLVQAGFPTGVKRAQWAMACERNAELQLGRRAFDSARNRLLLAGKIAQHGTRFLPVANTPAT